jgi:hypothetical protein
MFPPYAFLAWIRTFLPFPATGSHKKVLFHPAEDPLSRLLPSHFLPGVTSGSFTKDSLIRLHSLLPRPLNPKRNYVRRTPGWRTTPCWLSKIKELKLSRPNQEDLQGEEL